MKWSQVARHLIDWETKQFIKYLAFDGIRGQVR